MHCLSIGYNTIAGLLSVDLFGLAELDLWWQWHGLRDDDLSVLREGFAQVGLDGGGR